MDAEKVRKDFPLLQENPELVYLDNAATTQKPEAVIERLERFYQEENANVGRGLYDLANTATGAYSGARNTVAGFIGAVSGEIVFVRNTTEAMNLLASSLGIDGKIVVPEMAHHSEQLPWRRKARREGLELDYIPTTEDGLLDMDAAEEIIDRETALVSVPHVSNVFGVENPVKDIVELAHENDAYIVLDGAQSVPRKPVDVEELGIDFLAFSGHKMLGPTGIGVLYGRKELLKSMEPYQVGGGMIRSVKKESVDWGEIPEKFEAGTPNIAGAVSLAAAVDYLEKIGMERIWEHDVELSSRAREELEKMDGIDVLSPGESCLVSFTMEEVHPHDIAEILGQENVAVRAGHHCAQPQMDSLEITGTVRASPYIYNTEEDVDKLIEAVEKVREVFS